MPKIEIYTQPFCPYCARALNLLTRKGVPFEEIDAPPGSPARETARARSGGQSSVPQIFIDGRHLGGSEDLLGLDRKGELNALLGLEPGPSPSAASN
jgi:glutaredoxin 3